VGKNYHDHAREFHASGFDASAGKDAIPELPILFTKWPNSVIAHDEPIPSYLDYTNSTDYEGELTVVIGPGGRGISGKDAYDHVYGYTIVNDATARTLQNQHKQWFLGKSIDGYCPMGPCIVTADEVAAGVINHAIRFILPNSRIAAGQFVNPAFHEQTGDVHVHVHPQMPIGNPRIDVSGMVQSEERCLDRGKGEGTVRCGVGQCHSRRPTEVMAEDVEALHVFHGEQREHVFGDRLWLVAVVGFVAVGVPTQVGCDKRVLVSQALDDRKEFAMVLRPSVHAEDCRTATCRDVMERHAIYFRPLVGE